MRRLHEIRAMPALVLVLGLMSACADSPATAPEARAPRLNGTMMCVASGSTEEPPTVVPPSANGTCPPGFDLLVWW